MGQRQLLEVQCLRFLVLPLMPCEFVKEIMIGFRIVGFLLLSSRGLPTAADRLVVVTKATFIMVFAMSIVEAAIARETSVERFTASQCD